MAPPSCRPTILLPLLIVLLAAASAAQAHLPLRDERNGTEAHGRRLRRRYVARLYPRGPRVSLSREFLHAHNRIRRRLNEAPLVWDRGLARYARRWAARRFHDCQMVHSYGPYGENIFWGGRDHWTATEAVESWVRENQYYNADTNECVPGEMCGHYTQVVWRDSHRVGCARQRCFNGGVLIFCEYDPPGNYVNENPFGKVFDLLDPLSGTPDPIPSFTPLVSNCSVPPDLLNFNIRLY